MASALFVLVALLFSQWATASHACAMFAVPAAHAAHPAAPGCPDSGTPNTCEQHCGAGHAATDSAKSPSVPHITDFTRLRAGLIAAPLVRIAFEARRDIPPEPPPAIRFSVLRI
jgi:hypothetical protein